MRALVKALGEALAPDGCNVAVEQHCAHDYLVVTCGAWWMAWPGLDLDDAAEAPKLAEYVRDALSRRESARRSELCGAD